MMAHPLFSIPEAITEYIFKHVGITGIDPGAAVRFCFVGVFIAGLYVGLFFVFTALFGLPSWIASGAAFVLAVIIQYLLHTVFTFRKAVKDTHQIAKFITTVSIGLILSTLLTGVIWPMTGAPEIWALLIIIVGTPALNFILFFLWVYAKSDPRD